MRTRFFKLLLSVVILVPLAWVALQQPAEVYADVTHCGTISSDEIWAAGNNVHIVTCDLTVSAGVTLTIMPGAIVKLQNDSDIIVNGKLIAEGTQANPIYFTSYKDDTIGGDTNSDGAASVPAKGNWGTIDFNGGSDDSSIISRAVIRYSGSNFGSAIDDGAIFLSNASPELSYITFTDNYINGVELNDVSWLTDIWDNTTVVYVFDEGDVTIPALNTLTITPGMKIKLGNDDSLNVNGKLVAVGTITNPIYFSSKKDDTLCGIGAFNESICDTNSNGPSAGSVGNWGNIDFSNGSDETSTIARTVIHYSGSDSGSTINDPAIRLYGVSPSISYTSLVNNYRGIAARDGSTPALFCNDIYNNTSYGIYNNTSAITVTAENQWWGDASGPTHTGNPGGTGQSVSDGVDYTPWRTTSCLQPMLETTKTVDKALAIPDDVLTYWTLAILVPEI